MERYAKDGTKLMDDFDWPEYTERYYAPQVQEMAAAGESLLVKDSIVDEGEIVWRDKGLHFHVKALLENICELEPESVFEAGCAGGHNLANVAKLFPHIQVFGCDLCASQIEKMAEHFEVPEHIRKRLFVVDFGKPGPCDQFTVPVDYVFCDAVIMHLCYDKAVHFVRNMGLLSRRWIRITEDLGQHDFSKLFQESGVADEFNIEQGPYGYLLTRRQ